MMNARCKNLQWVGLALMLLAPLFAWGQSAEQRIEAAMARARETGIPVALLESKRAEGQAKGVPMDRIAQAIETRLQHLERAQQAMNRAAKDVDAAQLSVGADAIGAGVSEAVLTEVAGATGRERRSVAVAALTYLVSQEKLASDVALARVKEALAKGSEALANLPQKPAGRGRGSEGAPASGNRGTNGGRPGTSAAPSSIPAPGQREAPAPPPSRGRGRGNNN